MSLSRERLGLALAAGLVSGVAVAVVIVLNTASDRGVNALTHAKLEQVQATADSFNSRVTSEISAVSGLGAAPWQLRVGSTADQKRLAGFNINANARSGLFLVAANGVVTDGVLLRTGVRGKDFWPSEWPSIRSRLAKQNAIVLPVEGPSLTTESPTYDFVVAIRGAGQTSVRGALVFEEAVTTGSAFESEIAQLADPSAPSSAWFFLDSRGYVVATTQDTGLAEPVENARYRTVRSGVSVIGDRLVVTADIPSIGWRVVFRQDRAQFEGPLSGPLQKAGLILVLLLLATGLGLVLILVRRLRGARDQQRRLRELSRAQAEVISVVSHELRTPVAGVVGFLQTTVDHWANLRDTDRLNGVRRALTNARRLETLTRDVLVTESIENGRFDYTFEQLDLLEELQLAADAAAAADASRPVRLSGPSEPVFVHADPARLQHALTNLIDNARRHAPSGDPVLVEAAIVSDVAAEAAADVAADVAATPAAGAADRAGAADGDGRRRVRVSIVDHGPGVDPDLLGRIFDKFARGADDATPGTGLDLYIARRIVEAHDGDIWCESDPGRGTIFIIELPLTRRPAATVAVHA